MEVLRKRLKFSDSSGQQDQETRQKETKNKLLSTWYNMKYGKTMFSLDSSTTINTHSPVWLLGEFHFFNLELILSLLCKI